MRAGEGDEAGGRGGRASGRRRVPRLGARAGAGEVDSEKGPGRAWSRRVAAPGWSDRPRPTRDDDGDGLVLLSPKQRCRPLPVKVQIKLRLS